MTRRRAVPITSLFLLLLLSVPVAGQRAGDSNLRLNAAEISIGGRVQTQLNTTSIDTEPTTEIGIRRVRLEVAVRVSDRIRGTINPEFAGDRVSMKDAYLNVALDPAVELQFGHMYRPFGLLERTSSKRMPLIERGLRIRGITAADQFEFGKELEYSNRDLGLLVHGAPDDAPLGLNYAVGLFGGPLQGAVGNQDTYQASARLSVAPIQPLRIGAAWTGRDFAVVSGTTTELRRGNAFEIDFEYGTFAPGLHIITELSTGDVNPFTDARYHGGQAWIAYRSQERQGLVFTWEPTFRLSHASTSDDPNQILPGGTLVTPGLNIYFDPLNRVMLNYDIWRGEDDSPDAGSFKAMFQFAF